MSSANCRIGGQPMMVMLLVREGSFGGAVKGQYVPMKRLWTILRIVSSCWTLGQKTIEGPRRRIRSVHSVRSILCSHFNTCGDAERRFQTSFRTCFDPWGWKKAKYTLVHMLTRKWIMPTLCASFLYRWCRERYCFTALGIHLSSSVTLQSLHSQLEFIDIIVGHSEDIF